MNDPNFLLHQICPFVTTLMCLSSVCRPNLFRQPTIVDPFPPIPLGQPFLWPNFLFSFHVPDLQVPLHRLARPRICCLLVGKRRQSRLFRSSSSPHVGPFEPLHNGPSKMATTPKALSSIVVSYKRSRECDMRRHTLICLCGTPPPLYSAFASLPKAIAATSRRAPTRPGPVWVRCGVGISLSSIHATVRIRSEILVPVTARRHRRFAALTAS